ncbi:MAG TPA: type I pullulanase [Epulopiscium sp.]|nr:type I pullulanase [Candidatus Epulonipiscium sp.]
MYQKKKKNLISWLLVFVMFCANMLPVFAQSLQGGDQPNQSIKLHFNKPADWQEGVNIHYWGRISSDGTKDKEDKTEWPGNVVEKDGDWYTYTFEDTSYVNVIFNDGDGKQQTGSLEEITSQIFTEGWVVDNKIYSFNPKAGTGDNEIRVNVQKPSTWESIYLQANADLRDDKSQAITVDLDEGEAWYTQILETTGPAIEFKIVDTADIHSKEAKKIVPKGTKDATFMTTAKEVWVTADGKMHLSEPEMAEESEEPEESEVERKAPTLVKLHYKNTNNDYEGWNIHVWDKGNDKPGQDIEFMGEDEHGLYTLISLPDITDQVGFIIKRNGWVDKDYNEDLFIDTSTGNQEVFVTSGDPDFISGPIQYNYEDVKVTVNYTRRDNNYDGWNLWMWSRNEDSRGVEFTKDSEDGKIATQNFLDMKGKSQVGLIVRRSEAGNDWVEKDGGDRFIDLTYADAKGEMTVYLMQGDSNVYYGKVTPSITSAQLMDDFRSIDFAVNIPITDVSDVELWEIGGVAKINADATINSDSITGTIKALEELNIAKPYEVRIKGYGALAVGLNDIYGTEKFESLYTYEGELGALYTKEHTQFILWAPTATAVKVKLYETGSTGSATATHDMTPGEKGTWAYDVAGDLNGTYYTYEVTVAGKTVEAVDPYAKTTGTNGKRGMVIDLASTNPDNWKQNDHITVPNQTDAIIYELHVRDLSMASDSGITNKGKFTGLIETGTKNGKGTSTGLDHIKDLGVTHVHLLPVYDYLSVDESKIDTPQFNWGYDPQNYNVPEGFYSTDPSRGEVRVNEFKEMVKGIHDNDLGVIMDVVYNHLGGDGATSNLNLIVPGYYFRMNEKGEFSDGAGCGNETASERSMMRKFMVDSVTYWAKEYNVDGFRFDLMGLHDIDTMNLIRKELDKINPEIIMYGEGWTGGDTPLPEKDRSLKKNVPELDNRIAAFSDDLRDGLKGSVFNEKDVAFINGNAKDAKAAVESIKFGVVASTQHPQVDYSQVNYSKEPWAKEPTQTVSYVSAHDNHTLWDKIQISAPKATEFEQIRMDKFAAAVVLTSQGMPFIHAGEEMLRTKGGDENSYKSPDSVNQLDWARKDEYNEVYEYYKGLIKLRKDHPAFRMPTTEQVSENLTFLDMPDDSMVGYELKGKGASDTWDKIVVIHNGSKQFQSVELEGEGWITVVDSERAGVTGLARYQGNTVQVTPNSTHVFVDKASYDKTAPEVESQDITIYVEKPEDWEKPYIWFGKDDDWDMGGQELGGETSTMKAVEGRDGWYKKEIKTAKKVEFLFNNGNWDATIKQKGTGNNFEVMTKVAWVTADGRLYSHDPVDYADKEEAGDDDDEEGPSYNPEKDIAVHFRKPADWAEAYIHTWGELGDTKWPGNKLQPLKNSSGDPSEWYIHVFEGAKGKKGQFVLTQGASGPQSSDLNTDKTCWIDENFNVYDYEPSMTISVDTKNDNTYINYFKDEAEIQMKYTGENIINAAYTLDGTDPVEDKGIAFENNQIITFGKGLKVGDTITLKIGIDNGDMSLVNDYVYTKMEDIVIDKTAFNNLRTYQIMVAPYRDGDKGIGYGLGYGPSHHHGDLKGITQALPYIKELGMNAIWLTPIFESKTITGQSEAADRLDSTGYFTTDYFTVDPKFGTLAEAKELVQQAHEMGIYVFLDGVFGHHKAGVDIPASPSGYTITPGEGAETHNPVHYDKETLNFYKEVATYWIDELEIDGWRLDQSYQVSIPMQNDNYWRQIREAVEAKTEERKALGHKWGTLGYMVGEDWSGEADIQQRGYGPDFAPGLHSAFDFPGRYRVVQVLAGEEHVESGKYNQPATKLDEIFDTHKVYANHAIPNLMIGNHDLLRFGDLIQRAPHLGYGKENPDYWKRHKAAISFLASYTGPITLFYGEEIGMECEGYVNKGDVIPGHVVADDNISRMPGRLPTDGEGFTKDEQDLHDYTQKLMKLRSENPALWNGKRTHLLSTDTKYADLKQDDKNTVVYLLNTGISKDTFQLDEMQVGTRVLVDGITGEKIQPVGGKYTVPVEGLTARFLIATQKPSSSDSGTDSNQGSGSNQDTSKPLEVPSDIIKTLDGLSREGSNLEAGIAKVARDINKLDSVQAKAQAGNIITHMADIIAKEKGAASVKKLHDAMVILVESLISRVTTQEVALKNGKAILSASKVKEQLKDAEEIIRQLNQAVEKSNIQLTKSVRVTLEFEIDKQENNVAVSIPESLWKAIDKRANIAIKTKGVDLILEYDTFENQDYTINVKQESNIIDLTTDATFKKPIAVTFDVDQSVKDYPTVYQIIGDNYVIVSGLYNAEAGTIKALLSHFSLYTVKESLPKGFEDLKDITWQRKAIDELSARGYIVGMSETLFAPNEKMTRAEFATMVTRAVPTLAEVETVGFSDIKEGAWYYNSVATAVHEGWLVGRDDNKFDPAAAITRQEVATVLSRILVQKGYLQTINHPEELNSAPWAKDAVNLYLREVETQQLLELDMSENATRAEVAVMIFELIRSK